MGPGRKAYLLMLLACPPRPAWAGADANGVFADDVETGTTLTSELPPGRWDTRATLNASVTVGASAAGARRGSFGLRLTDADVSGGSGSSGYLTAGNLDASSAHYHVRFWFRMTQTTAGADSLFLILRYAGSFLIELRLDASGTAFRLTGRDATGTYTTSPGAAPARDGQWHLVEAVATGLGTTAGARQLFVDGQLAAQSTGLDWTGVFLDDFRLGEPFGDDRLFQGTLDFDDVRASPELQPARLTLAAAATTVGACTPVTVGLVRSTDGLAANAPYLVQAAVAASSGPQVAFFQDAACTQPGSLAGIAAGASSSPLYFRASGAGAATLTATHLDFLPGSATVTVAPGASGALCGSGSDCQSGHCVDGVCCNSPCAGACEACSIAAGAAVNGTCVSLPGSATCDSVDAGNIGPLRLNVGCASAGLPLWPASLFGLWALLPRRGVRSPRRRRGTSTEDSKLS